LAYLCNSGSPSTNLLPGTISIIDIKTNTVIGVIEGFDGPGSIVISKHSIAYVNNYGASGGVHSGNGKTVSVVDLNQRKIIDTIIVDQAPRALALSPCHKYLYVIAYVDDKPRTGKLNVISTKTNKIITTITGFFGPFGISVTKDSNFAFVTNFGSNDFAPYGTTVSVMDLNKYSIIKNIQVGIQPSRVIKVTFNFVSQNFCYL
jgi:DNA-binding beta-propeller fold protein YncE